MGECLSITQKQTSWTSSQIRCQEWRTTTKDQRPSNPWGKGAKWLDLISHGNQFSQEIIKLSTKISVWNKLVSSDDVHWSVPDTLTSTMQIYLGLKSCLIQKATKNCGESWDKKSGFQWWTLPEASVTQIAVPTTDGTRVSLCILLSLPNIVRRCTFFYKKLIHKKPSKAKNTLPSL